MKYFIASLIAALAAADGHSLSAACIKTSQLRAKFVDKEYDAGNVKPVKFTKDAEGKDVAWT